MAGTGPTAQNNPDAFVGKVTLSVYEPYPVVTGTNMSSLAPASAAVVRWIQPQPVIVKNMVFYHSLAAGVPAATGQASTGSNAHSFAYSVALYSRQDYTSNSSNLAPVGTASFGLSATLGYSSTSQVFGMSWATDTTGGTSATTVTSSDAAWSNLINGPRLVNVPFSTTLTAGEYWGFFQHSSSSATSASNVTLMSNSQMQLIGQASVLTAGLLGGTATVASMMGPFGNCGVMTTTPTTSTTMAISVVSQSARQPWFVFSNA